MVVPWLGLVVCAMLYQLYNTLTVSLVCPYPSPLFFFSLFFCLYCSPSLTAHLQGTTGYYPQQCPILLLDDHLVYVNNSCTHPTATLANAFSFLPLFGLCLPKKTPLEQRTSSSNTAIQCTLHPHQPRISYIETHEWLVTKGDEYPWASGKKKMRYCSRNSLLFNINKMLLCNLLFKILSWIEINRVLLFLLHTHFLYPLLPYSHTHFPHPSFPSSLPPSQSLFISLPSSV